MAEETFDRINKGFGRLKSNLDAVYDYYGANIVLEKYAFALPVVSKTKYNDFAEVFCKLGAKSDEINFNSLWIITARRGAVNQESARDLFDDIKAKPESINKKSLNDLIGILGKSITCNGLISCSFLDEFSYFIAEKVQTHSFKRKEIVEMQQACPEPRNDKVRDMLKRLATKVEQIHQNKQNRDIKSLNDWAYKHNFNGDDLIKQLSFRSTYINLLYETLVKENDIKDINIQEYYHQHRLDVQKKVAELTGTVDAKGKEIVRKYAINKVYKAIGSQDKFKHNTILPNLDEHRNQPVYNDVINILAALDGGDKNRMVYQPVRQR